jgi:hypothetical protein
MLGFHQGKHLYTAVQCCVCMFCLMTAQQRPKHGRNNAVNKQKKGWYGHRVHKDGFLN